MFSSITMPEVTLYVINKICAKFTKINTSLGQ